MGKENRGKEQGKAAGQPALLALLQEMTPPKVEMTEGGVACAAMSIALSASPCVERGLALTLDETLAAAERVTEFAPRPRPPSVRARLDQMERRLHDEICPKNQVQRITLMLRKHREKLQAQFAEWDADSDGEISKGELIAVMEKLGLKVRRDEVESFFAEFDPDGSGSLNLKEFYGVAYSRAERLGVEAIGISPFGFSK